MTSCPDRAGWECFLDDQVPAAERAAMETHLETCAACVEMLERLTAAAGKDLPFPADLLGASGSSQTNGTLALRAPGDTARYEFRAELNRGGMGVIYEGYDRQLRREVAVKVLRDDYRNRSDVWQRFLTEAQVSGQLQHPNIAPVHDVGRLPDGSPYIAMKLVRGQTLKALLESRPDPGHELPRYLGIFEQVCQAAAYAHSKGVIHRDLKPANVMVGEFGEVQVMDWGLAKVLAPSPADKGAATSSDTVLTSGSGTTTQAGSVLGTPAYMAPEQARGELAKVDTRADVFGLGALLCEILTGAPPYRGTTEEEIKRSAEAANLGDAWERLRSCGADAALADLAERCLAADRDLRPADAGAVAWTVGTYLTSVQDRLRRAEQERAAAEVRVAEARKRHKLTLALAAAALSLVLLGAGAWWWWREHTTRRVQDLEKVLQEIDLLQSQGKWPEVLAASRSAQSLLGGLPEDLERRAHRLLADADVMAAIEEARREHDQIVPGHFNNSRAIAKMYEQAFAAYGIDILALEVTETVDRIRTSALREHLVAALDAWAWINPDPAQRERFLQIIPRTYLETWRAELLAIRDAADQHTVEKLVDAVDVRARSPTHLAHLGSLCEQREAFDAAVRLLQRAQRAYQGDYWISNRLASNLRKLTPPDLDGAIRFFGHALALRENFASYVNRGHLWIAKSMLVDDRLQKRRCLHEAIADLQRAVGLKQDYALAHYNLGVAWRELGCPDKAADAYLRTIQLRAAGKKVSGTLNSMVPDTFFPAALRPAERMAYNNLGEILIKRGAAAEAVRLLQEALRIMPDDPTLHNTLGAALLKHKAVQEATSAFRQAIRLDPNYAEALTNLGSALRASNLLEEAIDFHQQAIAAQADFAPAHYNLGLALSALRRHQSALTAFREACRLKPNYLEAHYMLGKVLLELERVDEAVEAFRQALRVNPCYAEAHNNLGVALARRQQWPAAITAFRRAVYVQPQYPEAHFNLGRALVSLGLLEEGVAAYREAIRWRPRYPQAYNNLGLALAAQGRLPEAIAAFRQAVGFQGDYPEARLNLGFQLHKSGDFAGALAALKAGHELVAKKHPAWSAKTAKLVRDAERFVRLDAHLPLFLRGETELANEDWIGMAEACFCKQFYATAARLFEKALGGSPERADDLDAGHRLDAARAALLAAAGRGTDPTRPAAEQRVRLRQQALTWLRSDLVAWIKELDKGTPAACTRVLSQLRQWQADPDLASVRDSEAAVGLPEAEQEVWRAFWRDVARVLRRARSQL